MKISLFVPIDATPNNFELQTFEVSEEVFASIKEQVTTFAKTSSSDAPAKDLHIILEGQHFEFPLEQHDCYQKIKSKLQKQEQSDDDVSENLPAPNASQNEANQIQISLDSNVKPMLSIQTIITDCLQGLQPQLQILINEMQNKPYLEKIKKLNEFPSLLAGFNEEVFSATLDKINPKPDLFDCPTSEKEKRQYLEKKLSELIKQREYLQSVMNSVSHLKTQHLQASLRGLGGITTTETFNQNYLAIMESLNRLQDIIAEHEESVRERIAELGEGIRQYSIVVRTWYVSKDDDEQRKILGIPSDGHTTVELYKNKNERIYLGFYVTPNQQKSKLGKVFKKIGLPTPDPGKGYFVDLDYDKSLVGRGKKYSRCETVVIKCDRPGAELDFDAAYAWAQQIKAKYPVIELHGKKIQIIDDYNFYNNNCASFGAEALRQAGAGRYIPYSGATVMNIDSPTGVRSYAQSIEAHLAEKQIASAEDAVFGDNAKSDKEKYRCYIGFAIDRLKLICPKDEASQQVIENLIAQLHEVANNLLQQPDESVNNYLNDLFASLYQVVNQLIEKSNNVELANSSEIVVCIKNLSTLMPVHEQFFCKAINANIAINLEQYKALITKEAISDFQNEFMKMNQIVQAVTTDDSLKYFHKSLQIRTTLFKLEKQYRLAFERYKTLCKKNKKDAIELANLKVQFMKLNDYYLAVHKQLFNALSELRQEIYLKQVAIGGPESRLDQLQKLLLPEGFHGVKLSFPNILQNAKSENTWAMPDAQLKRIKSEDQTAILMKAAYPSYQLKAPSKPNVLAFWKWKKRHQHFELENKANLYRIVNNNQISWQTQLHAINTLVNKEKPNGLKFWRRDERHRYEEMGARAKLICLVKAFSEGKLSETALAVELEKVIPHIDQAQRSTLQQFKQKLLADYEAHIDDLEANHSVNYAKVLRNLFKNFAGNNDLSFSDSMRDGAILYAGNCYKQLKEEKEYSQNPQAFFNRDKITHKTVTAKQQLAFETGLWRRAG